MSKLEKTHYKNGSDAYTYQGLTLMRNNNNKMEILLLELRVKLIPWEGGINNQEVRAQILSIL